MIQVQNLFKNISVTNSSFFLIFFIIISFILLFVIGFFIGKINESLKINKERKDAIKRSKAVLNGQLIEQIAPLLPNFPCNIQDARFIGKPIDFIAFCTNSENDAIEEILFIEVKTGESKLSEREKQIKKAISEKKVRYVEYRF